jgi:large subunit ribosomal protein L6
MSRIGKKIINIPGNVSVEVLNNIVNIKGPLGALSMPLVNDIDIKNENGIVTVLNNGNEKDRKQKAVHGLSRALISNMITGVSAGFKKVMEIVGVGYRAVQQGKDIEFNLGYSHTIKFVAPEGINLKVLEPTKVEISGIDKQKVGQIAANIRGLRPPEPYKGKGIRYKDEYIRKKAGKAGKA